MRSLMWTLIVGELTIKLFLPNSAVTAINDTIIGDTSIDDRLIWLMEKSGNYLVKSDYHFLHKPNLSIPKASSCYGTNKKIWSTIWSINTLLKIKHFLWKVASNSLPTGLNLHKRKILESLICSLCGAFDEGVEHCILLCSWIECTWFGSSIGIHIPKPSPLLIIGYYHLSTYHS